MTDQRLEFARELARECGALALAHRGGQEGLTITRKGLQDFVTQADMAVEKLVRERIAAAYPQDAVLGEEEGLKGDGPGIWILDPIDGTTNFMRGTADWGISIAYADGDTLTHGVIYMPDHDLMVSAVAGGDCTANDREVRVSAIDTLDQAIVQIGYSRRTPVDSHTARLNRILSSGAEYRRTGAATMGLLAVALGRAEAYYEPMLNIWDGAAGMVLIRAAGGVTICPPLSDHLAAPQPLFAHNGKMQSLAPLL